MNLHDDGRNIFCMHCLRLDSVEPFLSNYIIVLPHISQQAPTGLMGKLQAALEHLRAWTAHISFIIWKKLQITSYVRIYTYLVNRSHELVLMICSNTLAAD